MVINSELNAPQLNTFLPYPDYEASARVLDSLRLNKQKVEAYQLLMALRRRHVGNDKGGWQRHPALLQWVNYEQELISYSQTILAECLRRGMNDTLGVSFRWLRNQFPSCPTPWWLGAPQLHSGMRASLLSKDLKWYSQFNWSESPIYGYWWPSHHAEQIWPIRLAA